MTSTPIPIFFRFLLLVAACLLLPKPGRAQAPATPLVTRALQYLSKERSHLGLTAQDIADPLVTDAYTDAHNGVGHVYLRQRYQGLEVVGTELSLHFTADGQLLQQTGTFVPRLASAVKSTVPVLTALAATRVAAQAIGLTPSRLREIVAARPASATPDNYVVLRDEALSTEAIPVQLTLVRHDDSQLLLAWELQLAPPGEVHRWRTQVDAVTGKVVSRSDVIIHERITPTSSSRAAVGASAATAARGTVADGASYNVFAFPLEGPGFGPRTLLTNPADPLASPFGWHDTDGQAGAEYTITRGNNAYAFTGTLDQPDYSPDGTASLTFDFPYDITKTPLENRAASVTNLFYLNNAVHDVTFQYGFNEVSGNFQQTNYSGKGLGNDAVQAVAQDTEGTDNAYFSPDVDGKTSSMHMFLWPQPFPLRFEVTAPASIAGTYTAIEGQLGPGFTAPISNGKLVLVKDASATPTRACDIGGLVNGAEIKGNVALIDRGDCNFSVKIMAAQDAGAIAVVMINNVAGAPFTMGGTEVNITIPSLMISLADGNRLKAALAANSPVTVAVQRLAKLKTDRDGSFDNVIVAHEYTHGISNRLTGGPARVNCLPVDNGKKADDPLYIPYETMGEGWSDFFGLWFTTKTSDKGASPRSVGTYVLAEPTTGIGIRNKPYSTDFSINNSTYELIGKTYTETHDIGEVWAEILWDLNWAMIARYGYSADLYHGTGGNNKTMQLVMDGMKLQPCRPGFVTGRDAILKADVADFKGANKDIIWQVFARRGVGFDAVQGTVSARDNKAGFALPASLATQELLLAAVELYPNPAQDAVRLRATVGSLGAASEVELSLTTLLGQQVLSRRVRAAELRQGTSLDLRGLANGIYLVRLQTEAGAITRRLTVSH